MDKIANLIISLKNAGMVGKEKVYLPFSKLTLNIANLLKKEGYVKAVKIGNEDSANPADKYIEIVLEYVSKNNPKIKEVKRISKSSQRVYTGTNEIPSHKRGYGLVVVSTPKGIMSGKDARKEHVGGEILFSVF
jgi:small subunit ribosomal protein S8